MSGRATQFGIDGEDLRTALDHIARLRNISLHGLHIYMGTRILDHRAIVDNTMRILALADEISAQIASPLAFIDVGGGFGVPYFKGEPELDLDALSDEIAPEIARRRRAKAETRIAFELGRFLTAPAGVFVTRVRSTKRAKGRDFAVCDGGSNCHSAAAGYGSALRKNFPMSVIGKEQDRLSAWTITGPLCTPTDIVGQDVALPEIVCGDLICIHQSGAYGPSASPVHFLGFGHPAETMVDGDSITMIREADSLAHLLAAQVPRQISISPQTSSEPDKAKMREVLYVSA
jgi:diaminopimelate decarboxylase